MKVFYVAAVMFATLFVSGCGDEEVKTVAWWEENEQARMEKLEECLSTDDDAVRRSPNCLNAVEAKNKISLIGDDDEYKSPSIN